ncbi:ATP-binding protein [Paeniglutamicibacter gangotriensis]|nr:ATP-binding protein [Paeniglutamicibacter gangotriensis]
MPNLGGKEQSYAKFKIDGRTRGKGSVGQLRIIFCFTLDDFLTVGIDQNIASDLFGVLADREHRLPTVIVSQTDPSYWVQVLPDRVAGGSIVNWLANNTRWLVLGDTDMSKLKHEKARGSAGFWE